jgi:hypothetical protein
MEVMLKYLNFIVFQWVFIRLTRCKQEIIAEALVDSWELFNKTDVSVALKPKIKKIKQWYSFQGWIFPLTGWVNGFKRIGKPWFLKITKTRLI